MHDTGDARVKLTVDGHIAMILVDRTEKLSMLDFPMIEALHRAADAVDQMNEVCAVIIAGAGKKSFCAGGDMEACSTLSLQATRLTKLTISAAEGEEREAAIEAMAGLVAARCTNLAKGIATFRVQTKAIF
jgi:enoyl-CoA hydratase/carnithine racemase